MPVAFPKVTLGQILILIAKDAGKAQVIVQDILAYEGVTGCADAVDKSSKFLTDFRPIAADVDTLIASGQFTAVTAHAAEAHMADAKVAFDRAGLGGLFGQLGTFLKNHPEIGNLILQLILGGVKTA